jgi:hypothetical protein
MSVIDRIDQAFGQAFGTLDPDGREAILRSGIANRMPAVQPGEDVPDLRRVPIPTSDTGSTAAGPIPLPAKPVAAAATPGPIPIPTANPVANAPGIPLPTAAAARAPVPPSSPSAGPIPLPATLQGARQKVAQMTIPTINPATGQVWEKRSQRQDLPGIDRLPTAARIPLRIFSALGDAFLPALTASIPGTPLHHALAVRAAEGAEQQQESQLSDDQKRELEAQQAAEAAAGIPLKGAQAEEALHKALEPVGTPEQQAANFFISQGMNPADAYRKLLETKTAAEAKELTPEQRAYDDLIKQGKEPLAAYGEVRRTGQAVPAGDEPLGNRVPQLRQALLMRYQVSHPDAKELPPGVDLPDDAKQKDFDRADKVLEAQERALEGKSKDAATQLQRDEINAIRQQTQAMAAAARQEREDIAGQKVVIGTDKNGKTIMLSREDAKKAGLENVMEAPSGDVTKAFSARQWLPLANKQGTEPHEMGILQVIDKLDQKGALGPLASRWNDFMTGKWGGGTGDPEVDRLYSALRVKMGLSKTLLMNLHVGARGGSYLLEHFEDMANAKKMDANILREGIQSELDYAKDRAMLPNSSGSTGGDSIEHWKRDTSGKLVKQ